MIISPGPALYSSRTFPVHPSRIDGRPKRRSWTSALDHTSIPRLIYSRRSVQIFTTSSLSIVRHSDTLFIRIRLNYHQDRLELTLVLSTATAYLLNVRVGKQDIYLFSLLPLNAVVRSPIVKSCSFSAIYPGCPHQVLRVWAVHRMTGLATGALVPCLFWESEEAPLSSLYRAVTVFIRVFVGQTLDYHPRLRHLLD